MSIYHLACVKEDVIFCDEEDAIFYYDTKISLNTSRFAFYKFSNAFDKFNKVNCKKQLNG